MPQHECESSRETSTRRRKRRLPPSHEDPRRKQPSANRGGRSGLPAGRPRKPVTVLCKTIGSPQIRTSSSSPSNPLLCLLSAPADAGQRARMRSQRGQITGTAVNESQATELTLTLSQAAVRPIQQIVRTAGTIDKTRKVLTADVFPPDAALMQVGQRVRTFPLESKSSMFQARITRVMRRGDRVTVEATLTSQGRQGSSAYVTEIVVERGEFLSVPNEAIIEEGDTRIVYVQKHPGHFEPQEVHTILQGELYTQVMHGLSEGDQVVTFGSFFIDSEYKLKTTDQPAAGPTSNAHHHN